MVKLRLGSIKSDDVILTHFMSISKKEIDKEILI